MSLANESNGLENTDNDNGTLLKSSLDKRPIISNLVSNENEPIAESVATVSVKPPSLVPSPSQPVEMRPAMMPTMMPPTAASYYNHHYPDYYQYYNQFSSYYQQLPPISLPPPPTQADMIHLYNSYLYQNYSKGMLHMQQQQQQQQQYQQQVALQAHMYQSPQVPKPERKPVEKSEVKEDDKTESNSPEEVKQELDDVPSKKRSRLSLERDVGTVKKFKVDSRSKKGKSAAALPAALPAALTTALTTVSAVSTELSSTLSPPQVPSNRPFLCTEDSCRWSFARLSDLKRHMKSHQPPQFQCPYWRNDPTCHRNGGAFNRLDVLKRHLKLVHYVQDRALYPPKWKIEQGWCRACQSQFSQIKDFFNHVNECSLKVNPTEWKQHYDENTSTTTATATV